jgi:NnrS protein
MFLAPAQIQKVAATLGAGPRCGTRLVLAPIPQLRAYPGPAILSYGFGPFFLFGAIYPGLAILLWLPMFFGSIELPITLAPPDWHVHEMLYGYLPAVLTGFLLTAIPNWTGRIPLQGGRCWCSLTFMTNLQDAIASPRDRCITPRWSNPGARKVRLWCWRWRLVWVRWKRSNSFVSAKPRLEASATCVRKNRDDGAGRADQAAYGFNAAGQRST